MNNENKIIRLSFSLFIKLSIILFILSVICQQIAFILGFVLGYITSLIVFLMTILSVDYLLLTKNRMMLVFSRLVKMLIYSIGFILAIKLPSLFNLIFVALGYFMIKMTIFYNHYRMRKRGEV